MYFRERELSFKYEVYTALASPIDSILIIVHDISRPVFQLCSSKCLGNSGAIIIFRIINILLTN